MKADELFEILDAALGELEGRPRVLPEDEDGKPLEEPRRIVVRGALPKGIGVKPETIADPSATTAKTAKLHSFTVDQAKRARAALAKNRRARD